MRTPASEYIACALLGGVPHLIRCLTFVEGVILADLEYLSKRSLYDIGTLVGQIGAALTDFRHAAAVRALQFDVRRAKHVLALFAKDVQDARQRQRLEAAAAAAWRRIDAVSVGFRSQIIHADLAHYNLVVSGAAASGADAGASASLLQPTLCGVIDFGDVVHSWAVGDLATAIASLLVRNAMRGQHAVLQEACHVVAGYHAVTPLNDAELSALWSLIVVRAIVLVASVENLCALDPQNTYNLDERALDWLIFDRVVAVPAPLAEAALRFACAAPPSRACAAATAWLHALPSAPPSSSATPTTAHLCAVAVDLGVASDALVDGNWRAAATLHAAIVECERAAAVALAVPPSSVVALGAWGEARLVHAREHSLTETPTVHLGVDVFVRAGTAVVAPCRVRVLNVDTNARTVWLAPLLVQGGGEERAPLLVRLGTVLETRLLLQQFALDRPCESARGDILWWGYMFIILFLDFCLVSFRLPGRQPACKPRARPTPCSLRARA